jgi:tRNA(Ile)-lysidine synthase
MDKNKIRISLNFTPPHLLSGLPENTPVLLAFSGGADSRALLHLLAAYCRENGAPLYAAHVNHGIRGEEALRDREFCKKTAASYGIECFVLDADVPSLAKEHGESLETEARRVRYGFFDKIMREHSIPLLATAHNSDDCLETLIFNIARGSGLRGITSIPQVRVFGTGFLIRPLLMSPKKDIIEFCRENGLDFVTDSTNSDTRYSRNLIRHKIIPALEKINPGVRESSARLSAAARECCELIDKEAEKFLSQRSGKSISASELCSLPPAVLSRVLSILCAGASGKIPEEVHIAALSELLRKGVPNSALSIPGNVRAKIESGNLVFVPDPHREEERPRFQQALGNGFNALPGGAIILKGSDEYKEYKEETADMTLAACIRLNPSSFPLAARSLREGDVITRGGMTKKVRKLLSETKLPLNERYLIPIVTGGSGEILWIPGIAEKDGAADRRGIRLEYYKLNS